MRSEDEMVAYALEASTALLPYLPELLADLKELGSDADAITSVIRDLNLSKSMTVVDLGCGKGAVAVEVAKHLNFRVLGIDLFEPFIDECIKLAESQKVSELCQFIHGDVSRLAGNVEPRDIAIFAALGDVLGSLDQTVSVIRQYTKPGGYMVIGDGFIKDGGSSNFPGFEQYAGRADMIARLTAHGDILVRETVEAYDRSHGKHREVEMIAARAKIIAARRPEIALEVLSYAAKQAAEYDYMDKNFVGANWILKRSH